VQNKHLIKQHSLYIQKSVETSPFHQSRS